MSGNQFICATLAALLIALTSPAIADCSSHPVILGDCETVSRDGRSTAHGPAQRDQADPIQTGSTPANSQIRQQAENLDYPISEYVCAHRNCGTFISDAVAIIREAMQTGKMVLLISVVDDQRGPAPSALPPHHECNLLIPHFRYPNRSVFGNGGKVELGELRACWIVVEVAKLLRLDPVFVYRRSSIRYVGDRRKSSIKSRVNRGLEIHLRPIWPN